MFSPLSSPFELFDITPSYIIDFEQLDRRYFHLQSQFHPDRLSGYNDISTRLNKAYQALKDPMKRAEALLEHYKIEGPSETIQDPLLLEEIMEFQEALEDQSEGESLLQSHIQNLEKEFQAAIQSPQNKEEIQRSFLRLRYFLKLSQRI